MDRWLIEVISEALPPALFLFLGVLGITKRLFSPLAPQSRGRCAALFLTSWGFLVLVNALTRDAQLLGGIALTLFGVGGVMAADARRLVRRSRRGAP